MQISGETCLFASASIGRADNPERATTTTSHPRAKRSRYFDVVLESCGSPYSNPPFIDYDPAPAPPTPDSHLNATAERKVLTWS